MKKYLLTIVSILFSFLLYAQSNDVASKLPGKWKLTKHLYTEKGKTDDLLPSDREYTYEFKSNKTYSYTVINNKEQSVTIIEGKWKLLNNGKKLFMYDNKMVGDTHLIADKTFTLIRISTTEFVTKELLFGMDLLGTSYYKKQ